MPNKTIESFIETQLGLQYDPNTPPTVALIGVSQLEVFMHYVVGDCRKLLSERLQATSPELLTELDTLIYQYFSQQ